MSAEQETRDIAVEAKTLVKVHMDDCEKQRERLDVNFGTINGAIKSLGESVSKLQIRAAFALGAFIAFGKILDYFIAWVHH